jgi:hypothetical protein
MWMCFFFSSQFIIVSLCMNSLLTR